MAQRPPGGKVNAANLNFLGLNDLSVVVGTETIAVQPADGGPNVGLLISQLPIGGGQVNSVQSGDNITIDATDPINPIANLDAAITGVSVNGVALSGAGAATDFLNETGAYSVPPSSVPDPLLLGDGSSAAPTYSFASDTDLGWFQRAAGELTWAGVELRHSLNAGPLLRGVLSTATVPNICPNSDDSNTGIGTGGALDTLNLIAGGINVARMPEVAGVVQFILPQQDNMASPSLAFGDGDTGFMENVDDNLRVVVGGTIEFEFTPLNFQGTTGGGPAIRNNNASATNPNICPDKGDLDTGLGHVSADRMSLVVGGVSCIQIEEVAFAPQIGFFVTAPVAQPTGVAVTAAGIHAALVTLGLITA